jgi:hypothetical protein
MGFITKLNEQRAGILLYRGNKNIPSTGQNKALLIINKRLLRSGGIAYENSSNI